MSGKNSGYSSFCEPVWLLQDSYCVEKLTYTFYGANHSNIRIKKTKFIFGCYVQAGELLHRQRWKLFCFHNYRDISRKDNIIMPLMFKICVLSYK